MSVHMRAQVGTSCFPAEATVEVQGKGTVSMEELNYGDKVGLAAAVSAGLVGELPHCRVIASRL